MLFSNNPYLASFLAILLFPLTLIYFAAVSIRHFLYDINFLKSFKSDKLTVSIGNITVGGTGKTPTVISLVNSLSLKGLDPLIITRGYGRKTNARVILDKNTPVSDSGDEALTIFEKTNKTVVCDRNRTAVMKDMGNNFDIIVLDDAFQHRKVRKDIDFVLIDESRFLGNHLLIPSGILRDKISRLKKCDVIILSKVKDIYSDSVKNKLDHLRKFKKKILISKLSYSTISNGRTKMKFSDTEEHKISLFCGIGNPHDFFDIFDKNNIVSKKIFSDHFDYNDSFEQFADLKDGSDILITTYKDFVKLSEKIIIEFNIYYLDIDLVFYDSALNEYTISDMIGEMHIG